MGEFLIKISVGNLLGFAINPFIRKKEKEEILKFLDKKKKCRLAFVDLAPSDDIRNFIFELLKKKHELVIFYDHHLDEKHSNFKEMRENIQAIECIERAEIKFVSREDYPSCARLVSFNQWFHKKIDLVFFHDDFDGFTSFLKGAGIRYPKMEQDADILDGSPSVDRSIFTLSMVGKFIQNSFNLVPYFSYDPVGYSKKKQEIYQRISNWLSGKKDGDFVDFYRKVLEKTREIERFTLNLVSKVKLMMGKIAFCDIREIINQGEKISFSVLKREIISIFGDVLLCFCTKGHFGDQISVELPPAWRGKIDLRDFLPEGIEGRVPGRVQIPSENWGEFLEKWNKGYILAHLLNQT